MEHLNTSWRSADGTCTNVYDLESSHIRNIIRCLKGHGRRRIPKIYAGLTIERWLEVFAYVLYTRQPNYKQIKQLYPIY